jgi:hypothetical protein
MKHFLIFRKNIQCTTSLIINMAANIRLVLIMHGHPLVAGNAEISSPAAPPSPARRKNKIQDQP